MRLVGWVADLSLKDQTGRNLVVRPIPGQKQYNTPYQSHFRSEQIRGKCACDRSGWGTCIPVKTLTDAEKLQLKHLGRAVLLTLV